MPSRLCSELFNEKDRVFSFYDYLKTFNNKCEIICKSFSKFSKDLKNGPDSEFLARSQASSVGGTTFSPPSVPSLP